VPPVVKTSLEVARSSQSSTSAIFPKLIAASMITVSDVQSLIRRSETLGTIEKPRGILSMCDVFVSTGVMSHRALDVAMPGRPPFEFARSSSTLDTVSGTMGLGWRHNWEVVARIDADLIVIRDGLKPKQEFPASEWDGVSGPSVVVETERRARLAFPGGETLTFDRETDSSSVWLLSRRADSWGNTVDCLYHGKTLMGLRSSAGWESELRYRNGYLAGVSSSQRGSRLQVVYEHDGDGRLVRIVDQYGGVTTFDYDNDLIVRHRRPNGVTRYLCYDHRRRCVFNWR
jgi:YD repeat-containing protein